MIHKNLIAPQEYNRVSEFEEYKKDRDKLALNGENEEGNKKEITYAELIKNANKIGHTFLKAGLKKGDTVLVMSPRLIDTYEVYIAALKLGIIVSPAADMLRTSDLAYRIKNGDDKD